MLIIIAGLFFAIGITLALVIVAAGGGLVLMLRRIGTYEVKVGRHTYMRGDDVNVGHVRAKVISVDNTTIRVRRRLIQPRE